MENLFNAFKVTIPNYDEKFEKLFSSFSNKGGGSELTKLNLGKHFSNNYELYMYAFFMGLYLKEKTPISENVKRINFSHAIQKWGGTNSIDRKDFTVLQEYVFMAAVSKTDFDIIDLDRGIVTVASVVKKLRETVESYTNTGLHFISEKLDDNVNSFLDSSSFLNELIRVHEHDQVLKV